MMSKTASLVALMVVLCSSVTFADSHVTQYGITWTFDGEYTVGQFVNGDYYVVDPGAGVNIISISPGYAEIESRHTNGSMINPAGSESSQSYDSYPTGWNTYNHALNVGVGISSENPLVLIGGQSLVTSISNETPLSPDVYTSLLKAAAVLTCLSSAPPAGSFRPGYSDPYKTLYNTSQINSGLLLSLEASNVPDFNTYAGYFQRPWIVHNSGDVASRFLLPNDNVYNNYYYPAAVTEAALMLHTNAPYATKEPLLINFIQYAIDAYGVLMSGMLGWNSQAGFGHGKKLPILFAGILLNDPGMKSIGSISGDYADTTPYGSIPADYIKFAEDMLTFHVSQDDVDITNGGTWNPDDRSGTAYPYTSLMIGMPEWSSFNLVSPQRRDAAWYAIYRDIGSGGRLFAGTGLSIMMLNGKELWNRDCFFDYGHRYMQISQGNPCPFGYQVPGESSGGGPSAFVLGMYNNYWSDYDTPPPPATYRRATMQQSSRGMLVQQSLYGAGVQ